MGVAKLKQLKPDDEQRADLSGQLLRKLYAMGLVDSESSLAKAEKVTVSCFCRRRLPVVLVRLKMAPSVKEASKFEYLAMCRFWDASPAQVTKSSMDRVTRK